MSSVRNKSGVYYVDQIGTGSAIWYLLTLNEIENAGIIHFLHIPL